MVERFFSCSPTRSTVPGAMAELVTLLVDPSAAAPAGPLAAQAKRRAPETARATRADVMGAVLVRICSIQLKSMGIVKNQSQPRRPEALASPHGVGEGCYAPVKRFSRPWTNVSGVYSSRRSIVHPPGWKAVRRK